MQICKGSSLYINFAHRKPIEVPGMSYRGPETCRQSLCPKIKKRHLTNECASFSYYMASKKEFSAFSFHFFSISTISFSIFMGLVAGAYRLITLPSRETRNFVKFHLIFLPKQPPACAFKKV